MITEVFFVVVFFLRILNHHFIKKNVFELRKCIVCFDLY